MSKDLKERLFLIALVVAGFAGAFLIWVNSPMHHQIKAAQRQEAINYLIVNQWRIPPDIRDTMMQADGITFDDLQDAGGVAVNLISDNSTPSPILIGLRRVAQFLGIE